MNEPQIGSTGLPEYAQRVLSDMIALLGEHYHYRYGSTAAFWAVAHTLAQQLGEDRT